jgi:hypothetical protein
MRKSNELISITKRKLSSRAGDTFVDVFRAFPEYKQIIEKLDLQLQTIRKDLSKKCYKQSSKCASCPIVSCCDVVHTDTYVNPEFNPYFSLLSLIDMDSLFREFNLSKITIQDILEGKKPFAYIIKVEKFQRTTFTTCTTSETNKIIPIMYLSYCQNPILFLDDITRVQKQLDTNLYADSEIRNWDKLLYYILYLRTTLGQLNSYDLFTNINFTSESCCVCEYPNSYMCKYCKVNKGIKEFYNMQDYVKFPFKYKWNDDSRSSLQLNCKYVNFTNDLAINIEENGRNQHVEFISRYALYLSNKLVRTTSEHSFKLPQTKTFTTLPWRNNDFEDGICSTT